MRPKAILFDFNGVFVKAKEDSILDSVCQKTGTGKWIARSNYILNIVRFEEGCISPRAFWQKVFPSLQDGEYKSLIEAEYEKPFERDGQMYSLCQRLGGKLPLYCLSNSNFLQGKACRKQGLYSPFAKFFLSHETRQPKPFFQAFRHFLLSTGLKAHECIFVDDSLRNIIAARLLGFSVVWFKGAKALREKLLSEGAL